MRYKKELQDMGVFFRNVLPRDRFLKIKQIDLANAVKYSNNQNCTPMHHSAGKFNIQDKTCLSSNITKITKTIKANNN